jgi:hypothetical protein
VSIYYTFVSCFIMMGLVACYVVVDVDVVNGQII